MQLFSAESGLVKNAGLAREGYVSQIECLPEYVALAISESRSNLFDTGLDLCFKNRIYQPISHALSSQGIAGVRERA